MKNSKNPKIYKMQSKYTRYCNWNWSHIYIFGRGGCVTGGHWRSQEVPRGNVRSLEVTWGHLRWFSCFNLNSEFLFQGKEIFKQQNYFLVLLNQLTSGTLLAAACLCSAFLSLFWLHQPLTAFLKDDYIAFLHQAVTSCLMVCCKKM